MSNIEWSDKTYTSTIRQNAKCKCGAKKSRTITQVVKRVYRSDNIGCVSESVKRTLEDGSREQALLCDCGKHLFYQDVKGTYNANHKCNAKCLNSISHICECSCGGKNHGAGHSC